MQMTKEELGERIRLYRKRGGYTQQEFAKILGISAATLSSYETGKTEPTIDIIGKIAALYNTTTDAVLDLRIKETENPYWS